MVQTAYHHKLKDPRWQRLRLEVFNRDNFKCTVCRSRHKELQVHHIEYIPGIEPWEYPIDMLLTMCVDDHAKEKGRDHLQSALATAFKMKGFLYGDLSALTAKLYQDQKFTLSLMKILRNEQRVD